MNNDEIANYLHELGWIARKNTDKDFAKIFAIMPSDHDPNAHKTYSLAIIDDKKSDNCTLFTRTTFHEPQEKSYYCIYSNSGIKLDLRIGDDKKILLTARELIGRVEILRYPSDKLVYLAYQEAFEDITQIRKHANT